MQESVQAAFSFVRRGPPAYGIQAQHLRAQGYPYPTCPKAAVPKDGPARGRPEERRPRQRLDHGHRGRDGQVATHLQTEVVTLKLELLNVALRQQGQQPLKLIVIELHGDQFSRPR
ncbi:S16 family serine protease [Synechococcus sp. GFB01]|uniref:S16 family serine protease n=1 Tax=Synechococcus sp. GFB01 TaxID=1662190 RepID=UPI00350FA0DB